MMVCTWWCFCTDGECFAITANNHNLTFVDDPSAVEWTLMTDTASSQLLIEFKSIAQMYIPNWQAHANLLRVVFRSCIQMIVTKTNEWRTIHTKTCIHYEIYFDIIFFEPFNHIAILFVCKWHVLQRKRFYQFIIKATREDFPYGGFSHYIESCSTYM